MVDTELTRRQSYDLAGYDDPIESEYRILDVYAGGIADEAPRIEAIATISAGAKNEKGLPIRSTDGRIYLHNANNRAPGLQAALEETAYRRLTIAFPSNDLTKVVQQRYACYSASALRAYGDENVMTVLEGGRRDYQRGSKEYDHWVKQCKVQASLYFCGAGWDNDEPIIDFPDGFGYYRLRTTSRNSIRSLLSAIQHIMRFTGNRIAGIPFELSIEQRDVAGADGKRQKVPVWVMVMRPPGGLTLNSRTLQRINRQALAAGESLMLPAPSRETVDFAEAEVGTALVVDEEAAYSDDDIAMLERGGLCDEDHWRKKWHATVKDSYLAADDQRHTFIARYTGGKYTSLTKFLSLASEQEANALVVAAQDEIALVGNDADLGDPTTYDHLAEESAYATEWDQEHSPALDEEREEAAFAEALAGELVAGRASQSDIDRWVLQVQTRMEQARRTPSGTPLALAGDQRRIVRVLAGMCNGDNARGLKVLRTLTGRAVDTSRDLRTGEADVWLGLIGSTTDRPMLERYVSPQEALL